MDVLTLQMSEFSAISVLEPLTAMRHLSHHRLILSAAACLRFAKCGISSAVKIRAVSSANLNQMGYSSMKSLKNKMNNVGESTLPCGRPM